MTKLVMIQIIQEGRQQGEWVYPDPVGLFFYDVEIGLKKGEKRKDDDNIKANTQLKVMRDELAHILSLSEDRRWTMGTVTQVRDPEGIGYVRFIITGVDHDHVQDE